MCSGSYFQRLAWCIKAKYRLHNSTTVYLNQVLYKILYIYSHTLFSSHFKKHPRVPYIIHCCLLLPKCRKEYFHTFRCMSVCQCVCVQVLGYPGAVGLRFHAISPGWPRKNIFSWYVILAILRVKYTYEKNTV